MVTKRTIDFNYVVVLLLVVISLLLGGILFSMQQCPVLGNKKAFCPYAKKGSGSKVTAPRKGSGIR